MKTPCEQSQQALVVAENTAFAAKTVVSITVPLLLDTWLAKRKKPLSVRIGANIIAYLGCSAAARYFIEKFYLDAKIENLENHCGTKYQKPNRIIF